MGLRFARQLLCLCRKRLFSVPYDGKSSEQRNSHRENCSVCGVDGDFPRNPKIASIRENFGCTTCGASLRYREQARVILSFYSRHGSRHIGDLIKEAEFRALRVYEPGLIGPFRKYFQVLDNYVTSFFWDDVAPGEFSEGIQCQDLTHLTYDDSSFDLVLTSDIFEHVRHPLEGFQEIDRILKLGGMHIFSIPVQHPMPTKTVSRVDTSGEDDIHILPPHYHGAPRGGRSLVYTDFGDDLVENLNRNGIDLRMDPPSWSGNLESATDRMVTFYWKK